MNRLAFRLLAFLLAPALFTGCVQVKEPLVDLGRYSSSSRSVDDPAPGVPDSSLSEKQKLQRELARCQERYRALENKLKQREDDLDKCQDRLDDCRDRDD